MVINKKITLNPTPIPMRNNRTLYTPALVIVTVVMLLLVFIGFSTYWNLDRARSHALDLVHREGAVIFQSIEAGTRTVTGGAVDPVAAVGRLLKEIGRHPDIAYIYILNKNGELLNSSAGSSPPARGVWHPDVKPGDTASRFLKGDNGVPVFELAGELRFESVSDTAGGSLRKSGQRIRGGLSPYRDAFMVIGLKMSGFSAARHEDMQHAFIMASILLVLGGGTIFFIFVIHRYQRMNRALKEARDYTRLVVDRMANGLLSIDSVGRVLSFNQHALDLLGISDAGPDDILLDRILDFNACGITETLSGCAPVYDREITLPAGDGRGRILSLSITPIPGNVECSGAVLMLRDLTEIKRLEEKVRRTEKLAALGKLSAAVAHEIRNPLSSIRGFARFLSQQLKERPEDREYADIMVREVDRINRVVTDLLNFARPLELAPEPVNPAELLAHPLSLVRGDAASRGISIHEHVAGDPKPVMLDSNLLTHALLNLLLNALFASGPGGRVDAGVRVEQNASPVGDEAVVKFEIEDDGPGISAEHMDKIFDPFFTTRENGTGLGLAIVHKFVEMHHGTIRVESPVPGKNGGCRFTLELPAEFEAL